MLLEGVDLAAKTASILKNDPSIKDIAAEQVFETMLEEIAIGICFEIHRSIKIGAYRTVEIGPVEGPPIPITGHIDVFGLPVTTITGLPNLKMVPQCECPNCNRTLAASRFAPHLEKCMGMGRNSSRLASRRLATSNKDSYREGCHEEEDDVEDEDWLEPGKMTNNRRKRDKNSPKRNKILKFRTNGNEQDGLITPPQSYDQLTLEERRHLLASICGVAGNSGKICTRSTRCPAHNDLQRREVRLRWLNHAVDEDSHIDIDSFSEGDTAALQDCLSQLSNASSPAESTISTSSNPSRGRREKSRRGKKGRPGSKNGSSRGSTPPMMD